MKGCEEFAEAGRMSEGVISKDAVKRFKPAAIIFAVLGLLLLAYAVRVAGKGDIVAGAREIVADVKALGAGFLLILALGGVRKLVRAMAWRRCLEGPQKLRLRDALRAVVMGDSIGTLLPLGSTFVSEPAKAAFVRDRVPMTAGLSAIAVENLFYSLSVMLFIFAGMLALLLSFPLPKGLRVACLVTLVAVFLLIPLAVWVVRRQWKILSGLLELLYKRGVARKFLETKRGGVRDFEERIYGFYARNRSRFVPILLLEACFHLAGVVEVYLTLYFITGGATWLAAFVFEAVNRVINVAFKFVPLRAGVDEAGTGWLAKALGFGQTTGVTVAIVRKARDLSWALIGLALLARRGFSLRGAAEEAQAVAPHGGAGGVRPAPSRPAAAGESG